MDIAASSSSHCDLQAALFGGGGAGELARSLHLLQRYITGGHQDSPVNEDATAVAITIATDTLCTHFFSSVTPNTAAQQLLISAIAAHILPFPTVAAACQRLSSNFSHRNHMISWVHTIIACLRSTSIPQPLQGGRATLQLLILRLLQVCVFVLFLMNISVTIVQELEKWAPSYIAACNMASTDHPVRMLLDACRVPCVVECCGQEGIGATVLASAIQVAASFLCLCITFFSVLLS